MIQMFSTFYKRDLSKYVLLNISKNSIFPVSRGLTMQYKIVSARGKRRLKYQQRFG